MLSYDGEYCMIAMEGIMVKSEDKAAVVVYVIFILVSIWAYANYLYVDERWIGALAQGNQYVYQ